MTNANSTFSTLIIKEKKIIKFITICDLEQVKNICEYLANNMTDDLIMYIEQIKQCDNKKALKLYYNFKRYYTLSEIYKVDLENVLVEIKTIISGGSTNKNTYISRLFDLTQILSKPVDKNRINHNLHLGAMAREKKNNKTINNE